MDNIDNKNISAGEYNFEKFEMTSTRYNPFISIGKSNRLGISQSFIDSNDISLKESADLFFDRDKKAIAVVFKDGKEGRLALTMLAKQGGYINAKAFFAINKIDPNIYDGRYHDIKKISSGKETLFVFELSEKK